MLDTRTPIRSHRPRLRADLLWVTGAVLLLAAAAAIGAYLNRPGSGVVLFAATPPVFARWMPHVGPGTAPTVLVAALVVLYGPVTAQRMRLRWVLAAGYATALCWTMSLAMIDGWQTGLARRLNQPGEYLNDVPGILDIPQMLREFASRILAHQPGQWTTHIAGHPPGVTLIFVWLDRIGLSGGGPAAIVCVLVGSLAAIAVPVTLAVLGEHRTARTVTPFLALFPGAVWIGASADGLFTGISACGIALLAVAASRRRPLLALLSGLVLGYCLFLSYGLVLFGLIAVVPLVLRRAWGTGLVALLGVVAVVLAFAASGFWWLTGYQLLVERYYQGVARLRPYWYWVWANFGCLVLAIGPATVAGVRRVVSLRRGAVALLAGAALLAILIADISGMAKAEVERIWLPFDVWLLTATALLPARHRRWWLAGQAATAIVVNHVLLTNW